MLRRREFRLLLAGQAISALGDRVVAVALAFAVLEVDGSASAVGAVLAARTLALVACLLAGGVVADRLSPRTVMVAADLVRVLSQGVIAGLVITGAAEVWSLAALSAVTGAATGFFSPASTGLLPAVVPPAELQQANGLRATALASGEVAGPLLAGVMVAGLGPGWALAVDAGSFAVSAALLAALRLDAREARAPASFVADLRDGWEAFRSRRWVWVIVLSASAGNLLWGAWSVLGPVVADRELGGARAWGVVLGAMGAGALVGAALAVRAAPRRPLVLYAVTGVVFALPVGALAAGGGVPLVAAGAASAGVALMLGGAVWESTLQRHIPQASLGRVSAYDWFGSIAFQPLGMILWGPLAALVGLRPALWAAFVLLVACSVALLAVADVRRLGPGPTTRDVTPVPAPLPPGRPVP